MFRLMLLMLLVSCATYAPKSYKQECADRGMVLSGVTSSSGRVSSYNYNTRSMASGRYSGEDVSCVMPKTPAENCKVRKIQESSRPVDEYNEWASAKQFVTGVGYFAFVVPGVAAKIGFDKQRDDAVRKGFDMEYAGELSCEQDAREPASQD